jgi:flavodoxin
MKILVVYYSRTNTTKNVAIKIQQELKADLEEIVDKKNRSGTISYLTSAVETVLNRPADIEPIKKNPSDYDLIIIGTPVWASTMATPILTYLIENKDKFKNVSFFCSCGSSGHEKTLNNMEKTVDKKALERLVITKKNKESSFELEIPEYINSIKKNYLNNLK